MSYRGGLKGRRGGERGGSQWVRGIRRDQQTLPQPSSSQRCIESIRKAAIDEIPKNNSDFKIDKCEYLASYNWLESEKRTILVPGAPPAWTPPAYPQPALKPDAGDYFRDTNGAFSPVYPVEPGVTSIYALSPGFDGQEIDLVACANTFGSLLSFSRDEDRTFRFGVEKLGNTVFFVRRENSPRELIKDVYGYGHSFPEAYTTWNSEVRGSVSHQRLIKYDFSGLICVIRSESDGYLPMKLEKVQQGPTNVQDATSQDLDLSLLAVQSVHKGENVAALTVKPSGRLIPQAGIFDLKTRGVNNILNMENMLPRLWANQTPNFILAYHKSGRFKDAQIQDVSADIKAWEQRNQELLGHLHSTLYKLIQIVGQRPNMRVEVRRTGQGDLQIWSEADTWSALPKELKKRWMGEGTPEAGAEGQNSADGPASEDEDSEGDDDYLRF